MEKIKLSKRQQAIRYRNQRILHACKRIAEIFNLLQHEIDDLFDAVEINKCNKDK